jgi:hypothetical protein
MTSRALEELKAVAKQRLAGGQGERELGLDAATVAAAVSGPLQAVARFCPSALLGALPTLDLPGPIAWYATSIG